MCETSYEEEIEKILNNGQASENLLSLAIRIASEAGKINYRKAVLGKQQNYHIWEMCEIFFDESRKMGFDFPKDHCLLYRLVIHPLNAKITEI